ncbi:MAG: hypothetical protein GXY47_02225 [Acidobacteria bacterium]|nr:hypothetical protein [Acidobacteriota bacterium]
MKHGRWSLMTGVLAAVLAVGGGLAAFQPSAQAGEWKMVDPQPKVGEKMRMASFLDGKIGFTGGAGDVGKAHLTFDGGQTWTVADTSGG